MEFTIVERMGLLSLLPTMGEGSRAEFRLYTELYTDISFSDEEFVEFEIKVAGDEYEEEGEKKIVPKGLFLWNEEKAKPKDINITSQKKKLICRILANLDSTGKLKKVHIPIYDRFMEAENGDTNEER